MKHNHRYRINRINTKGADKVNQFRKKPVVIEALNYNQHEGVKERIVAWAAEHGTTIYALPSGDLVIPTLEDGPNKEAKHIASDGDWIIKGVKNEFYPCKPDIFDLTYEPVREEKSISA